jgi:hypothetical protein
VGTFGLLLAGTPLPLVAAAVTASNVVAWTRLRRHAGAGRRRRPPRRRHTWYMVAVAAIESAGTAIAALLPTGPDGLVLGALLVAVVACYGGALLPTWLVAAGARVGRASPPPGGPGLVADPAARARGLSTAP